MLARACRLPVVAAAPLTLPAAVWLLQMLAAICLLQTIAGVLLHRKDAIVGEQQ